MRVVACGQQKGGVGKTTLVINLACYAVARGKKTAVIDMDTGQRTAERWSGRRQKDVEGPSVFPSSTVTIRQLIGKLRSDGYDWVFVDLPGQQSPNASTGLLSADFVLIPCGPSVFDVDSSQATFGVLRPQARRYAYLLSNVVYQERFAATATQMKLASLGYEVNPIVITHRGEVRKASDCGSSCIEMYPEGKAALEFAELYEWLEGMVRI